MAYLLGNPERTEPYATSTGLRFKHTPPLSAPDFAPEVPEENSVSEKKADPKTVAERLKGACCSSCYNFWNEGYCVPLTDIDSPVCGAFKKLPEDQKKNPDIEE